MGEGERKHSDSSGYGAKPQARRGFVGFSNPHESLRIVSLGPNQNVELKRKFGG